MVIAPKRGEHPIYSKEKHSSFTVSNTHKVIFLIRTAVYYSPQNLSHGICCVAAEISRGTEFRFFYRSCLIYEKHKICLAPETRLKSN